MKPCKLIKIHTPPFSLTILDFALGMRPTEGQQLPWYNPVEVAILYTLDTGLKKENKNKTLICCIAEHSFCRQSEQFTLCSREHGRAVMRTLTS